MEEDYPALLAYDIHVVILSDRVTINLSDCRSDRLFDGPPVGQYERSYTAQSEGPFVIR